MKKHMRFYSLLLAIVLVLSLCACGTDDSNDPSSDAGTSPSSGLAEVQSSESEMMVKQTAADTLFVGAYGYIMAALCNSRNMLALNLIYDRLFYHDYSSGEDEIKPMLAESYDVTEDDGGSYTFHVKLREGCYFESGREITAEDVLATWEFLGDVGVLASHAYLDIDNTYIDGKYDVYFKFYYYEPCFINYASLFTFCILSAEYLETVPEEDWWDPALVDAGGAYDPVELVTGSSILFKVRDDYWGWGVIQDRPNFDYLMLYYYDESSTMMVDYETGKLDVCLNISQNDMERILTNGLEHTNMRQLYGGNMIYFTMNTQNEYLADKAVREAIRCAIDFEAACDAAMGIGATVATGVSPLGAEYRIDFGVSEYDPDKAIALLEEAGYSPGEIELRMVVNNITTYETYAEIFQQYLAEVGITLKIESYDGATIMLMIDNIDPVDGDLSIYSYSGGLDRTVETFKGMLSGQGPDMGDVIDDGTIEELFNTARYAIEAPQAETEALQRLIYDDVWNIPLCQIGYGIIYRDYVEDLGIGFVGIHGLADIRPFELITE